MSSVGSKTGWSVNEELDAVVAWCGSLCRQFLKKTDGNHEASQIDRFADRELNLGSPNPLLCDFLYLRYLVYVPVTCSVITQGRAGRKEPTSVCLSVCLCPYSRHAFYCWPSCITVNKTDTRSMRSSIWKLQTSVRVRYDVSFDVPAFFSRTDLSGILRDAVRCKLCCAHVNHNYIFLIPN